MNQKLNIIYFKPEKQGAFPVDNGYCFATEIQSLCESGLILYSRNGKKIRIPFSAEGKRGALYGIRVEGSAFSFNGYNFYEGERVFTDPYAQEIAGLERFGDFGNEKRQTRGILCREEFDWEGDSPLLIPFEDTIIYGLNVRGFTMHKSSGVRNRGTFEGIIEKIDYLKGLGITAVELMPAYEFDECMYEPDQGPRNVDEAVLGIRGSITRERRVNCWGYQEGFYFAPKASYSKDRPRLSFKRMVKELHRNGIEVMMQFYFPPETNQSYIVELLKYWVVEYHIDGVRLCGFQIPFACIAQEPLLKETKIRSVSFPLEEIYGGRTPFYRNLASDNGNFRNDMRRYLKGDENLMNQVLRYQKNNPAGCAVVNCLADYDGFSLYDSVSYEKKHNEANGEDNRDGTEYNYTWNCGVEGESRKKAVLELRLSQIKNALCFLFLSQGIPYLFSGDEMGNTRFGNNNVYCQDNEAGWVKWKGSRFSEEIFQFVCQIISLRKRHPILHMKTELKVMDTIGCGYPDISYHGTEAWRPNISYISRMVGILLCGRYAASGDRCFYIALNMHWEAHELALPKLPKGMRWTRLLSTVRDREAPEGERQPSSEEGRILTQARSVCVYCSEPDPLYKEKTKKSRRKTAVKNEGMETF
jgi:glycogen operon protein